MTVWIGLTGGVASGKSKVANEFSLLDVPIIDSDKISRHLTEFNSEVLNKIKSCLGENLFDNKGQLLRPKLRQLVFNDLSAKLTLENILFPKIIDEIQSQKESIQSYSYGVIEIPLLIGYPQFLSLVNRVLVVDVDNTTQIARLQKRSGLSKEEALSIIDNQVDRITNIRHADDVVVNLDDEKQLREKIIRLHHYYQALYK